MPFDATFLLVVAGLGVILVAVSWQIREAPFERRVLGSALAFFLGRSLQ